MYVYRGIIQCHICSVQHNHLYFSIVYLFFRKNVMLIQQLDYAFAVCISCGSILSDVIRKKDVKHSMKFS